MWRTSTETFRQKPRSDRRDKPGPPIRPGAPTGPIVAGGDESRSPDDAAGDFFERGRVPDRPRPWVFQQAIEDAFEQAGIEPRFQLMAQYTTARCGLVAEGLGLAIVDPVPARDLTGLAFVLRPFRPRIPIETVLIRPAGRSWGSPRGTPDWLSQSRARRPPARTASSEGSRSKAVNHLPIPLGRTGSGFPTVPLVGG